MSTQTDPLDRLLQECLSPILASKPTQSPQETKLSFISLDNYDKWRPELPSLLAALVEDRTGGVQTIRDATHLFHIDRRLNRGAYLVRLPAAGKIPPLLTEVDMTTSVVFEINPYRSLLTAGLQP